MYVSVINRPKPQFVHYMTSNHLTAKLFYSVSHLYKTYFFVFSILEIFYLITAFNLKITSDKNTKNTGFPVNKYEEFFIVLEKWYVLRYRPVFQ